MKPAILLIDLQPDFLDVPGLEPAARPVVDQAARLLSGARKRSVPVIHVWTSVDRDKDRRMPHWKAAGRWACVRGTPGHAVPASLRPLKTEPIVHKTFFSAFSTGELDAVLKTIGADALILAGVHLHGCIRATVLDAYQRGLVVWVVEDAVASDDPLHAAVTQRYLASRAARFLTVESCLAALDGKHRRSTPKSRRAARLPAAVVGDTEIAGERLERLTHQSPLEDRQRAWRIPVCGASEVARATAAARHAWLDWRSAGVNARCEVLSRLSGVLEAERRALAREIVVETGKPLGLAQAEVSRAIALLQAVARRSAEPLETRCTENSVRRQPPVGVIALVTPWNNPVAIPLGKIAPALLYGNTVIWKPSPASSAISVRLLKCLWRAGCPRGVVVLLTGDRSTARALMEDPGVAAVSVTGSPAAGHAAQDICGRRYIPLQAELGGNNAAIIWSDCDLARAAEEVADAAFAFAGQRCTANRRVIVSEEAYDPFLELLSAATADLAWGDPLEKATRVGPLISPGKCQDVAALVARAKAAAAAVLTPHQRAGSGAYFPPTLVCCNDPAHEVVQEETFGPVLVVQKAHDWHDAQGLCNGVRQGLVASLFSSSAEHQERFLRETRAGILKINRATADANVEAPFGGWKASGIGPPEHGASNREFYTRTQAVYWASR